MFNRKFSDQVPINEDHYEPITADYIKKNMEKTFGIVEFLNGFIRMVFKLAIFKANQMAHLKALKVLNATNI